MSTDFSAAAAGPVVTNVTTATPDGAYNAGDVIQIVVTFDEPVEVIGGLPSLTLSTGRTVVGPATGPGATLIFNYAVQAGDTSADLDYASSGALTIPNGALVVGLNSGEEADLTLPAPGAAGSLGANAALAIDTTAPTVAITSDNSTLLAGQTATMTFTFSEATGSFTAADVLVSGGTLSGFSGSGATYTATFTPTANFTGAASVTVTGNSYADAAGNLGAGGVSPALTVDTARPALSSVAFSDTALKIGDGATVTFTFTEAVTGFTVADVTVPNGALALLSTSDYRIWTATLAPADGASDASNVLTVDLSGIADAAGNAGQGTFTSSSYAVDTVRPSLASSITISDTTLASGDIAVVTFTFTEAVTGFTLADVTAPNATLNNLASSDGGVTWTAALMPDSDVSDATNMLTLSYAGLADLSGNAGTGSVSSGNYAVATAAAPTAAVALSDTALRAGETATVTFTFSEAVTGFTLADATAPNGTLSNLATADNITYTATFTPSAGVQDASNVVTVDLTGVQNGASVAGTGSASSANFAIDTQRPTATVAVGDTSLAAGETATVTFTFSEAVTGLDFADVSTQNGALSGLSSSDGGVTWTATLTPAANVNDATNVIALDLTGVADAAGNAGTGSAASANYAVATAPPPAPPEPEPGPPAPPPIQVTPQPGGVSLVTGDGGANLIDLGAASPPLTPGVYNTVMAGAGADTVLGGLYGDYLHGGTGDDTVLAGGGSDIVRGGQGGDFLHGNVGDDVLFGDIGEDILHGGQGVDTVLGGLGADTLLGDAGDDVVRGGQGEDAILGGAGNDFIAGDRGNDTLVGGAGADIFHSFGDAGLDVIADFNAAEGDRLQLEPGTGYRLSQVGADTVVDLTGGAQVILVGVRLAGLPDGWIV